MEENKDIHILVVDDEEDSVKSSSTILRLKVIK